MQNKNKMENRKSALTLTIHLNTEEHSREIKEQKNTSSLTHKIQNKENTRKQIKYWRNLTFQNT